MLPVTVTRLCIEWAHTRVASAQNATRVTVSAGRQMLCTCASCGVSFQSTRRDALRCSRPYRLRARYAAQSAKEGP
jgi:hypothetical protein